MALEHPVEERARPPPRRGCPSPRPRRCRRSASTAATVSASGSGRRPQPTTVAPSRASSSADARPRPVPGARDDADLPLEQVGREDSRAGARHPRPQAYRATGCAGDEGPSREPGASSSRSPGGAPRARRWPSSRCSAGACECPPAMFERSRGTSPPRGCSASASHARSWWRIPVPAFLVHHPIGGPDRRRHRPAPVGRLRQPAENLGRTVARFTRPTLEPGQDLPAQLRERGIDPKAIAARGHDPPAPRPHLGDVGVPRRDASSSPSRSGRRRPPTRGRCCAATARRTTTTRSTTARSTTSPSGSSPTRASAAPSTCSATAASGSPSPRATAPATSR